jgi:hypothetical protein
MSYCWSDYDNDNSIAGDGNDSDDANPKDWISSVIITPMSPMSAAYFWYLGEDSTLCTEMSPPQVTADKIQELAWHCLATVDEEINMCRGQASNQQNMSDPGFAREDYFAAVNNYKRVKVNRCEDDVFNGDEHRTHFKAPPVRGLSLQYEQIHGIL